MRFVFSVPELTDIQDAYVIAVEDQARRRLEQLSALHKVQPVDISQVQLLFPTGNEGGEGL